MATQQFNSALVRLLPALKVVRLFGQLPFTQTVSLHYITQCKLYRVFSMLFLLSVVAAKIYSVSQNIYNFMIDSNKETSFVSFNVSIYVFEITGIFTFYFIIKFSISSCNFINNIIKYLDTIDKALGDQYNIKQKNYLISKLFLIYIIIELVMADIVYDHIDNIEVFGETLWLLILIIEQLQIILCQELTSRYESINEVLHIAKRTTIVFSNKNIKSFYYLESNRVEALRESHAMLGDAQSEINDKFGPILLFNISHLFSKFLCLILVATFGHSIMTTSGAFISILMGFIASIGRLAYITYTCDRLTAEVSFTFICKMAE
jgi:hypothetical protein